VLDLARDIISTALPAVASDPITHIPCSSIKSCRDLCRTVSASVSGPEIPSNNGPLLDYDFQFLACSGSLTNDKKMAHQLESWNNVTSNFATITIGGNDAGFSKVLIQCILRKSSHTGVGRVYCISDLELRTALLWEGGPLVERRDV
jgi:hypothetical protein